MTSDEAYSIVRTRDAHRCLRCGCSVLNIPSAIHHRRSKGHGGSRQLDTVPNMVRLCGLGNNDSDSCHGWAHQNPRQSRAEGWTVPRFSTLQPEQVPVHAYFGWTLLTPDGDYHPYEPAADDG